MGACGDLRHADKALGKCRDQRLSHDSLAYSDIMLRSEMGVAPSEALRDSNLGAKGDLSRSRSVLGDSQSRRSKPRIILLHYTLLGLVEV